MIHLLGYAIIGLAALFIVWVMTIEALSTQYFRFLDDSYDNENWSDAQLHMQARNAGWHRLHRSAKLAAKHRIKPRRKRPQAIGVDFN